MKRKHDGGFSLVEVLVAMTILTAIVIPVCTSMVLAVRINAKADAVLQARTAVSSAVESLMAEGIIGEDIDDVRDRFPEVEVNVSQVAEGHYYHVVVTDNEGLVSITTCIRAQQPAQDSGGEGQ